MVQCHFQASWQPGHVRLWRWTGTAANHGGPSPGRRPAAPVRRARSLELQEPGPPVWTVRDILAYGAFTPTWACFSEGISHWTMLILRHVREIRWILPLSKARSRHSSEGSEGLAVFRWTAPQSATQGGFWNVHETKPIYSFIHLKMWLQVEILVCY